MQSHGEQARASRRPRTPDVGGTTRVSRSRQSRNKIDGTPLPNASVFLNGLAFLDDYPYKGLMTACALMFCAIVRYALSLQPYSGASLRIGAARCRTRCCVGSGPGMANLRRGRDAGRACVRVV